MKLCLTKVSHFIDRLVALKIEKAFQDSISAIVVLRHNGKETQIEKRCWLRFLKIHLLNEHTNILQLNVAERRVLDSGLFLRIMMVCKRDSGRIYFSEVSVNSIWCDQKIDTLSYSIDQF
ncbi:MAG: hypothetical protein AAGA86_03700 [Bacteroidota bacterium]